MATVTEEEGPNEIFAPRNTTPEEVTAEFQAQLRELAACRTGHKYLTDESPCFA